MKPEIKLSPDHKIQAARAQTLLYTLAKKKAMKPATRGGSTYRKLLDMGFIPPEGSQ